MIPSIIDIAVVPVVIAASIFLPPLLDGVERKIKAIIHSRIGPPILQTWYDLLKLFGKSILAPRNSLHIMTLILMYAVLSITTLILFLYGIYCNSLHYVIASVALFMMIQALYLTIPFVTSNPFAAIGLSREIMIMLINEIAFITAFSLILYFTRGIYTWSFYYTVLVIVLLISSYVSSGRIPFDLAEAEPELASGILIEFSGPFLGIYHYTSLVKRFLVKIVPSYLVLSLFPLDPYIRVVLVIMFSCILWLLYATIAPLLGRSRVDIAPSSLLKLYTSLFAVALILFILGL